ncbi:MAG: hypothetical protein O7D96_02875, partial [SAR324 cluster bacterium]|nr:hypothetical protein [SAR324 cluster bacterium]
VSCRVAVEAGVAFGWERYIGIGGVMIGVPAYGRSAPYQHIYEALGITSAAAAAAVKRGLG